MAEPKKPRIEPCPLCGSENVKVCHETDSCGWRNFFVACLSCVYWGPQVQAPMHSGDAEATRQAANAWNGRARRQGLHEEAERRMAEDAR